MRQFVKFLWIVFAVGKKGLSSRMGGLRLLQFNDHLMEELSVFFDKEVILRSPALLLIPENY